MIAVALGLMTHGAASQAATPDPSSQQRPLFELGIGAGGGWVPDYPASNQGRARAIVVPYLIYRGEILRSDEEGARARARLSEGIELSLSASGSLPVSSSDNTARRGMPDLDWLGEIGPTLRFTLWRSDRTVRPRRILLDTPIRAVFSTDWSSVSFRGLTFSPTLAWEERDLWRSGSRLRASIAPVFATGRFMEYFYSVQQPFVLPDRPAYDADGGYLGTRLTLSWRMPITGRISLVAGGRVENFSGATNAGSPLFRTEWNAAVAIGVSVALWRSEARVDSLAEPFD
jgi:outer membrane scaffolding protein for murein synthesis (MipA/OmpV family)